MPENKKDKQLFTVARVFFLLIVIPFSLMAILIANGIFKIGITAKERAINVLDQTSQEEIKIRAINTADEVASFLTERKKDLLIATIIPATESTYKQFVDENKKAIWVKADDKIQQVFAPLYSEMSLTDRNGNELLKIVDGKVAPKSNLVNVSNPANTRYKTEDYFNRAKKLNKSEVYMSHVTGWYVNKAEFEKGKRFTGIIRIATPVFGQEGFSGVLSLALDFRHIAEFTDHIIPTQSGNVFRADASTGNYAYMVDNKGFVIAHPNDYHIEGLYGDGTPVPPLTEKGVETMTKKGEEVLNIGLLGFMDPGMPEVAKDAAAGNTGIKMYKFAGQTKFVAYAPIKFYSADYPKPGGFGWIAMGVNVEKFNEMAAAASKNIEKEVKAWTTTIVLIIIISIVLLFLISALLSKGIARSIAAEVPAEAQEAALRYDEENEEEEK
ncbi:MAG TPA: cache domain-containing protein [Syntrophales bacterium]|nr:cache domain-containing protein [Syntrophales bacterium]